ncbi:hypothetical protein KFK09_026263 [Dendrobium nobile]|uniref:Uncharacterized protein n=1 Tax=Dendrobium nobile TaxID=94219 RepID=A0A8T3A719_DENNO|nr:hypothetical protein KFK09_026263 [Dendrobium nobile]
MHSAPIKKKKFYLLEKKYPFNKTLNKDTQASRDNPYTNVLFALKLHGLNRLNVSKKIINYRWIFPAACRQTIFRCLSGGVPVA